MITKGNRILVRDEGANQGYAGIVDWTGAGVTATVAGNIATIAVPGGGGSNPSWYGNLYSTIAECDPQEALRFAILSGTSAATPTNITTAVARISYFKPPANITVNKIRFFGVGVTTSIYRCALYNGDTLARLTSELVITTASSTWGSVGSSLGLALTAGQLYFLAVSVDATGTTPGLLCMSTTISAAGSGQINVLPKSWPGNLDIDLGFITGAMAQFAVTTGALPDPAATIAAQAGWNGGMPLFFLDNNNA